MNMLLEEIPTPAPLQHVWVRLSGNEVFCSTCDALVVRANDRRVSMPCPGA